MAATSTIDVGVINKHLILNEVRQRGSSSVDDLVRYTGMS